MPYYNVTEKRTSNLTICLWHLSSPPSIGHILRRCCRLCRRRSRRCSCCYFLLLRLMRCLLLCLWKATASFQATTLKCQ